jgi:hypothetical protein
VRQVVVEEVDPGAVVEEVVEVLADSTSVY